MKLALAIIWRSNSLKDGLFLGLRPRLSKSALPFIV